MSWSTISSAIGVGLITSIVNGAVALGGVCAFGIIVYGGVLYTVSAGNASRKEDAKEWIKAAIYGLIILLGAYLILNTINPAIVNGV